MNDIIPIQKCPRKILQYLSSCEKLSIICLIFLEQPVRRDKFGLCQNIQCDNFVRL